MIRRIILCLLLLPVMGWAQSRTVSGVISDSEDGSPLPGANVLTLPSGTGTITGSDGSFSVNLKAGDDSLLVSFIGYQSKTVKLSTLSNLSNVKIALAPEAKLLDETVVIGYGTQRKSDLTGSIVSVKEEDLVKVPSASPLQALQGKAAGVNVTSASGDPGSTPVVRIRGVGTITQDAGPIYVVDGVILDNVNFLNSNDIASMEVLKDASATAIYGSRGANGVILITTKKGKKGKPVINLSYEYGQQYIPNHIDVMNGREFAEYVNVITPNTYNNLDRVPNTDWQELVFKDFAPMQSANLSISGADEKTSYYVGLGWFDREGVLPKSSYERFSVKVNNEYRISDRIRLGNNITVAKEDKENAPGVIANLTRAWPTEVPYNLDGSFAEVRGGGNALAAIEYTNSFSDALSGVGNIYGEVDLLKNLTFKSSFGFNYRQNEATSFTPVYYVGPLQNSEQSRVTQGKTTETDWLWEQTLNYKREIDQHRFDVLAGFTSQENKDDFIGGTVEDIIDYDPSLWYLRAGNVNEVELGQSTAINRIVSYLFRVNYSYDSRYLFTATYRRDGSTKFGSNNRYGDFPSFAAGWNIHNEEFMNSIRLLNRLKLRASWGLTGNEKISYLEQYSTVSQIYTAVFGDNEALVPGATYGRSGNPNLQWEATEQIDIGLEFGLLNNRLSGEVDYYNRITREALIPINPPGHLGNGAFFTLIRNVGDVQNRGVEVTLNWKDNIGDISYGVGGNITTVYNEVLQITETGSGANNIGGGDLGNGQRVTLTEKGTPVGAFYGYNVIGIFQTQDEVEASASTGSQSPGDLKFEDVNGDGLIDDRDRVLLGSYIPDYTYGFNVELGYKGIGLALDFYGTQGNEIYNGKDAVRPNLYNYETTRNDYWTGPGSSDTEPKPSQAGDNFSPSSYFIQDGSFFRLRSATLSYDVPRKWITAARLSSARVYLRGTNVFTLTDYTGYSPEIASSAVLSSGIDLGTYPITAIYSIGVNLTF